MTFITMPGLSDVKEPIAVPEGSNYDLRIIGAKLRSKDAKNDIEFIIEIDGEPEAANIFHYIGLVNEDDDDEKRKIKMLFAARFFNQFNIKTEDGVEMEQLVGARATNCKLDQKEWEGSLRNNLVLNPLPQEG